MEYLLAFFAMLAVDFFYTEYTKATADGAVLRASFMAGVMILPAALNTLIYVGNPWCVAASMAGAFAGTYLSMRRGE